MKLTCPHPLPLLLFLLLTPSTNALRKPSNSVLLSQIQTLTLRDSSPTTSRRLQPIPQLTCLGPGCKHYNVDIMRCKNAGSDYDDDNVQWTCTANIPAEFKLGSTDVICEGYENAEDPYVLKGSCGVEYRLLLTDLGREKFGGGGLFEGIFGGKKAKGSKAGGLSGSTSSEDLAGYLFSALFFAVAAWILWGIYRAWATNRGGPRQALPRGGGGFGGFGGGGGGGGGGNDNDDAPPPYYPRNPKPSSGQTEGWRPGFWTGALGGAAATYMMGGNNRRQNAPPPPLRQTGGGWFGGGNNDGGWAAGPSSGPATRASSSASSSYGSARHESTGFGSSRRR